MKSRMHALATILLLLPISQYLQLSGLNALSFVLLWIGLGVFVDIDHLIDCYVKKKKITFNSNELAHTGPPHIVPFHCWEWVPVLILIFSLFNQPFMFVTLSFILHLIMDLDNCRSISLKNYSGLYKLWNFFFSKGRIRKENLYSALAYFSAIVLLFYMMVFFTHGHISLTTQEPLRTIFHFQEEMFIKGNPILWGIFIVNLITLFSSALLDRYYREKAGEISWIFTEGEK